MNPTKTSTALICASLLLVAQTSLAQVDRKVIPVILSMLSDNCGGPTVTGNQDLVIQDHVDALRGVGRIEGFVSINPAAGELDLSPLASLTEITQDLVMHTVAFQTDVQGFDCLRTIGSSLVIKNNSDVTRISGFSSLETIGDDLEIYGNPNLTVVEGFNALKSTGDFLLIQLNPTLTAVEGFNALKSTGGFLSIFANNQLATIAAFPNLVSVGTDLRISAAGKLTSITGFPRLNTVGGNLYIQSNSELTGIAGFAQLTSTGISGTSAVTVNAQLDCSNPLPPFLPVDKTSLNLVNCPGTYDSAPSSAIPDNDPTGISDTISVSHGGTVGDIVVLLNIEHTYMNDLIVTLTHESTNTSIELMSRPLNSLNTSCATNDFNGRLDDSASLNINNSCAPVQMSTDDPAYPDPVFFQPYQALGAFDGESLSGNWTLTVSDNAGADTGTLNNWGMRITPAP